MLTTASFFLIAVLIILESNPFKREHRFQSPFTIANTSKESANNETNYKPTIMMSTESLVDPVAEQRGSEEAGMEEEEVRKVVIVLQYASLVTSPLVSSHGHRLFVPCRRTPCESSHERTCPCQSNRIRETAYSHFVKIEEEEEISLFV